MKNMLMWLGAAAITFAAVSCVEETVIPDTIQGMPYTGAATGTFNEWPGYSPTIHYDLKEDPQFKDLGMPTKNMPTTISIRTSRL